VAGIALIVVGAIPLTKIDDIRDAFPENSPATIPIIVVVLGAVIFTISFFGCCGAIRVSNHDSTFAEMRKTNKTFQFIGESMHGLNGEFLKQKALLS
jgi:uncharacterized integral membrane protein